MLLRCLERFLLLCFVFGGSDFGIVKAAAEDSELEYHAICDAGSTGTRLYVFTIGGKANDDAAPKARTIFVKKVKPGLSSYVENPSGAIPALVELLASGAEAIPAASRKSVPLTIFGTAGMRLLPMDAQDTIWKTVRASLAAEASFPFDPAKLTARTITGDDEGLWAMVAANFLTGRVGDDLRLAAGASPVSVMDLGGSSTQVGIPVLQKSRNVGEGALVHSYLGFGMTKMREKVRADSKESGFDAACYMRGYEVESGLMGSGQGPACRRLIQATMEDASQACRTKREQSQSNALCLQDLSLKHPDATNIIKEGKSEFYALSGFTYATDFVRWWLKLGAGDFTLHPFSSSFPAPSLEELRHAVDAMCAGAWAPVPPMILDEATAHPYTTIENAHQRCFQVNYILVLLGDIYGFPLDARPITFALEVAGEDLEWPLGALLSQRLVRINASGRSSEL